MSKSFVVSFSFDQIICLSNALWRERDLAGQYAGHDRRDEWAEYADRCLIAHRLIGDALREAAPRGDAP